jgi:hypothetical protein
VVFAVDLPVHVEHHDRVDAERAASPVDFLVPVDGGFAAAVIRPRELRQVHRWNVRDLGGER